MYETVEIFCQRSSIWSVRFTDQGKAAFLDAEGSNFLIQSTFSVSVPSQKGRSQEELCTQVRSAALQIIRDRCDRLGIELDYRDISSRSYDYFACVLQH